MKTSVVLVTLALGIQSAFACLGGYQPPPVQPPPATTQGSVTDGSGSPAPTGAGHDITTRKVGEGVNTFDYDPAGYNAESGGPVNNQESLRCDFDGEPCCWSNAQPPLDQLEWQLAKGVPEHLKMHTNFGPFGPADSVPPLPTGRYLIVAVEGASASDEAQFVSCSIACSRDEIKVRARHWSTSSALVQVCTRKSFFDRPSEAPLLNCQELPRSNAPGPTEISLPPNALVDIVFVASNLVDPTGDVVLLDDIEVSYESCDTELETTTSETTTESETDYTDEPEETTPTDYGNGGGGEEDCEKTKCDFENGDKCSYSDAKEGAGLAGFNQAFAVITGTFENRVTGVARPSAGSYYAAAYLFSGDRAALITDVDLLDDREISFQRYEATDGMQVRGCCNSPDNCPFVSPADVAAGDRKWKDTNFICPAGTTKIIFVCENQRANQGACAFDEIKMMSADGSGQEIC